MYQFYRSLIVLIAFAMMAAGVSAAQDVPAFQPTILEDGVTLEGQLEDIYTAVLYAFHGSEGDLVDLSMNQIDDGLDPYIVLLGANGELLAVDDDSGDDVGGPQYSALITDFELPYDGSYYLLTTSYNYIDGMFGDVSPLAEPLAYEITVSGNTTPTDLEGFDPAVSTFTAASTEGEAAFDLELTAEQPVAYLTFDGTAGDTVSIGVAAHEIQPSPIIHLFAPDGRRFAMNTVLDGDSSTANLDDIELPMDGQYLFMTMDVFFMDRLKDPESTYGLGPVSITVE